ncbi:OmpA family protein [Sphingomonas morindae]|uniref:OmpA family protein n=1 Tax=Sphingomonas morindae TaxID=1541170 RepID=A0ABY4X8R9_9SPHN|nr:OmpA family protein [Sphingomonas morindae]USI73332.1 OmpA family protein [Sphingomonas morindae]
MALPRSLGTAAATLALLATAGCVTDPNTGERTMSKTGIGALGGAAGGAVLGALVGGRHSQTETLLGAGIGALAGTAVGSYMDQQERRLRAQTAGSGIAVERRGDELTLRMPSSITFDTNSYLIQPRFQATLDRVAQTLAAYPQTFVDVYGYTDSTGGDAINVPLSQNRARAVADYLAGHGVVPPRIGVRGMGAQMPIASNDTPDGRQQNRRVEIKLTPVTQDDRSGAS